MDIRVLVFNSGTFNRAELSKMSEQELWQLWEKDDDQAQVQMYYLDEFSCAFNDEEVSDQDWLYFVDYDNIKQSDENPAKVWVMTQESCVDGEVHFNVVVCDSEETAKAQMQSEIDWLKNESIHFKGYDPNDESLEIEESEHRFFIMDECDDYYEEIIVDEKEITTL